MWDLIDRDSFNWWLYVLLGTFLFGKKQNKYSFIQTTRNKNIFHNVFFFFLIKNALCTHNPSFYGKSKQDILSFNIELKNRLIIKWPVCVISTFWSNSLITALSLIYSDTSVKFDNHIFCWLSNKLTIHSSIWQLWMSCCHVFLVFL